MIRNERVQIDVLSAGLRQSFVKGLGGFPAGLALFVGHESALNDIGDRTPFAPRFWPASSSNASAFPRSNSYAGRFAAWNDVMDLGIGESARSMVRAADAAGQEGVELVCKSCPDGTRLTIAGASANCLYESATPS